MRLFSLCARRGRDTVRQLSTSGHERPDHLTRTATEPRRDLIADARIVEVREETPTVREITLDVATAGFNFQAGNWVDFFIDGVSKVGGYSMCSVPSELPRLRLAVKRSKHPPAAWCHSEAAQPGAVVQVKAGGQFSWSHAVEGVGTSHLLLVAGGIGINPLYSILQEALQTSDANAVPGLQRISLLYSAARPSELAFRRHLEQLAASDERLRLSLHVTKHTPASGEEWSGCVGRIGVQDIEEILKDAGVPNSEVLAYVCGPPGMTDEFMAALQGPLKVPAERVRSEKWW